VRVVPEEHGRVADAEVVLSVNDAEPVNTDLIHTARPPQPESVQFCIWKLVADPRLSICTT